MSEMKTLTINGKTYTVSDPNIPQTLPNPHALTFTGAVSATYDGSEAVSVEIPEGGSGGSESEWRLINTITITEETNLIDITTDSDGNSFELSEVFIHFDNTTYATAAGTFYFRPNSRSTNNMACYGFIGTAAGSNAQRYLHAKHIAEGFWRAEFIKNDGHLTPLMTRPGETITSFSFYGQTFAAGTIYAYGR